MTLTGNSAGVQVGPSFPSTLDGVQGSSYNVSHAYSAVVSPSIPPGSVLSYQATHQILAIDPINNIVQVDAQGTFYLASPVPVKSLNWTDIKLLFGGGLVVTGSIGSGRILLRRRRTTA